CNGNAANVQNRNLNFSSIFIIVANTASKNPSLFLHLYCLIFNDQKNQTFNGINHMQTMTKIALISASVLSMGALTACQSTSNVQSSDHPHMMKHHEGKKHHLSPEQREQFKAKRAERMQSAKQLQQACDNKAAGSAIQVKSGDKTIDGTCQMVFKADRKEMNGQRGEYLSMQAEYRPMRDDIRGSMMRS